MSNTTPAFTPEEREGLWALLIAKADEDDAVHNRGEFHTGNYCGLEDRAITDRYQAFDYGFDEGADRAFEFFKDELDTVLSFARSLDEKRIAELEAALAQDWKKAIEWAKDRVGLYGDTAPFYVGFLTACHEIANHANQLRNDRVAALAKARERKEDATALDKL